MNNRFWIFDTNTLISALLKEDSTPAMALYKALDKGVLLISQETVTEYFDTFSRVKFEKYLTLETRFAFLENIISNAMPIVIKERVTACRDPKDNMFLSLAVSAAADCIITGDKDLLILHPFRKIPILSPSDFLQYLKT